VNPDRAGKYRLQLSDGSVMKLYRQTIADFGLYAGMEMTEEELHSLKTAAGQMSAKMRAIRIVAASGVSKQDLEHRLIKKGETAKDAQNAVAWMSELDLIDDRKTAEHIVSICIHKGYGISRTKQTLYESFSLTSSMQEYISFKTSSSASLHPAYLKISFSQKAGSLYFFVKTVKFIILNQLFVFVYNII